MRASILKRLDALERAADQATMRPLVLIESHLFDPVDRDAYWAGDDGVLKRYIARDEAEPSSGTSPWSSVSILSRGKDG